MKKAQLPLIAELDLDDKEDVIPKAGGKFTGTDNPRHMRVLHALMLRPRRREEIDRIAGASNGPDLIADLRRRGLDIPCQRTPGVDRDNFPIAFGVYELTHADRRKVFNWQARSLRAQMGN